MSRRRKPGKAKPPVTNGRKPWEWPTWDGTVLSKVPPPEVQAELARRAR